MTDTKENVFCECGQSNYVGNKKCVYCDKELKNNSARVVAKCTSCNKTLSLVGGCCMDGYPEFTFRQDCDCIHERATIADEQFEQAALEWLSKVLKQIKGRE